MKRDEVLSKIEEIATTAATAAGLEIVEVELKGSGRHQLLRIVIDKPGGITHADCEFITREAGEQIDAVDPISGPYELEVSSPGVERALRKWQDWERFAGQKVKVVLKQPVETATAVDSAAGHTGERARHPSKSLELKHFDGAISRAENRHVTIELPDGTHVTFPFDQVSRANLKFEW